MQLEHFDAMHYSVAKCIIVITRVICHPELARNILSLRYQQEKGKICDLTPN